jgi:hypothetical protein
MDFEKNQHITFSARRLVALHDKGVIDVDFFTPGGTGAEAEIRFRMRRADLCSMSLPGLTKAVHPGVKKLDPRLKPAGGAQRGSISSRQVPNAEDRYR